MAAAPLKHLADRGPPSSTDRADPRPFATSPDPFPTGRELVEGSLPLRGSEARAAAFRGAAHAAAAVADTPPGRSTLAGIIVGYVELHWVDDADRQVASGAPAGGAPNGSAGPTRRCAGQTTVGNPGRRMGIHRRTMSQVASQRGSRILRLHLVRSEMASDACPRNDSRGGGRPCDPPSTPGHLV